MRSRDPIVSNGSTNKLSDLLTNKNWVFDLSYTFRNALDIKYEKQIKIESPNMVWAQG